MTEYDATEMAYRNGYEAGCRACEAEIVKLSEKCQRLEKELDAAVADLLIGCDCESCKWLVGGDCTDLEHEECRGEHWQWRGYGWMN